MSFFIFIVYSISFYRVFSRCYSPLNTDLLSNVYNIKCENNIGRYLTEVYPNLFLIQNVNGFVNRCTDDIFQERYLKDIFSKSIYENKNITRVIGYSTCFSSTYGPNCWVDLNDSLTKSFEFVRNKCGVNDNNGEGILIIERTHRRMINLGLLLKNIPKNYEIIDTFFLEEATICMILEKFQKYKYIIGVLGSELIYSYFFTKKIIISVNSKTRMGDSFFSQLCKYIGNTNYELMVETTNYYTCIRPTNLDTSKCNDFILDENTIKIIVEHLNNPNNVKFEYYKNNTIVDNSCGLGDNTNKQYII